MVGTPNRLLSLPPAEYVQVQPHLEEVAFTPRNLVLRAGEPLTHVYFPCSAVVALLVRMANGDAVEVASVGHQGMLGISVALQADPAPYDMLCQIPGNAMRMARQAFQTLLDDLPIFRRLVFRYTLCLFHEVARTAACNRLHTVDQRLARWLLEYSDRATADTYPLTHVSLAQMLGVRRSYVTQTAHALQQSGLIQYRRGTLRILDRQALKAIACEDYAAIQQEYARLLA